MRKSGYYWVRRFTHSVWEVAHYSDFDNTWGITYCKLEYTNKDFYKIDENRIIRKGEK